MRRGSLVRSLAAAFSLAVSAMALPDPAMAQPEQVCRTLPPRDPMPREARPEYMDGDYWRARVAELSRIASRDMSYAQMIFLGDSITHSWHLPVWEQYYGQRGGVNFGAAGDFVQSMLWRLQQGGQWPASLRPKLAVLLIGTNNSVYSAPPENTALGIAEVVRLIRQRSPTTRILLVGILPRGADAADPQRRLNQRVNELIARCADNRFVFYTDVGGVLLDRQARLTEQIAPDRLHLSAEGYARLSAALEPAIQPLMR
ncbi:GDSL-type esterase/lipase family protein [Roseomonas xinghualingensis]|uniref:GDSL-type esterase/lipase family protein n=1 Tax=Roseomonas xinghualingensis TaxID=2986475 RepID=UPI0021F19CB7|nr:GDSL-type esterase/lipase family protein [Roseomonas sp. SXEYE001]MCV4206188.1 GDSL-type esterase/lipase family protein [Roseomonas sp. SXEYE001]